MAFELFHCLSCFAPARSPGHHPLLALQISAAGQSVPVQVDTIKLLAMVPQLLFGLAPAPVSWNSASPRHLLQRRRLSAQLTCVLAVRRDPGRAGRRPAAGSQAAPGAAAANLRFGECRAHRRRSPGPHDCGRHPLHFTAFFLLRRLRAPAQLDLQTCRACGAAQDN